MKPHKDICLPKVLIQEEINQTIKAALVRIYLREIPQTLGHSQKGHNTSTVKATINFYTEDTSQDRRFHIDLHTKKESNESAPPNNYIVKVT